MEALTKARDAGLDTLARIIRGIEYRFWDVRTAKQGWHVARGGRIGLRLVFGWDMNRPHRRFLDRL